MRSDLETSPLSLLNHLSRSAAVEHTLFGSTRIINFLDVDWFQSSSRLFVGSSAAGSPAMIASVFNSSALSAISSLAVSTGDSAAGFCALAASVVAGSSVLAVFLTRVHIVKLSRNSCMMRFEQGSATMRDFALPWGLSFGLV